MELDNKTLVEWLRDAPAELYPQCKKIDHHSHYVKLRDYLIDNVHNEVTFGANLIDPEVLLNDHGPGHIDTVISRASYLVSCTSCSLNPYEVYILLCCIQLHDVGNIFGRYKHEIKAVDIMRAAEGICGRDQIEAIKIRNIAESHGGRTNNGDKDKISGLQPMEEMFYGSIRPQLLASILRYADELADDKTRAHRTLLKNGSLPVKSEVYHAYAMCLESVKVNHLESGINLNFHLPKEFLSRKFGKINENGALKKVYLLDEIYERVLKMHYERVYCMRFSKNSIELANLFVSIEFYDKTLNDVFPKISFTLSENGYPSNNGDIFKMCPELTLGDQKLNARYVISQIKKK